MTEKIFGEIQTTEDLNELANNLRKTKEFDEIRLLCKENDISADIAEEFIKGDRLLLEAAGHQEKTMVTWSDVQAKVREPEENQVERSEAANRIRLGLLLPGAVAETEKKPEAEKPLEHTIDDVREKLEAELTIYKDGDSKYVVEHLIELCKTDKKLLEAIMLPHKSYDKAFQYFFERSRTVGYTMPHGNMVYLDNDKAVSLSVEYFKKDEKAKPTSKPAAKPAQKPVTPPPAGDKTKVQKPKGKPADAKSASPTKAPEKPKQAEPAKEVKPKKKEIDGQMSLFDF